MSKRLKNVEVRFNTDFASDACDGYVAISFTHPLRGDSLDWIDDDGTLCAEHESNLHGEYDGVAFREVRAQLADWLREYSTISVAMNDAEDFFVFTAPAGELSFEEIERLIEVENTRIGGAGCTPAFDPSNRVRVYRNGVFLFDQEAQRAA